MMFKTQFKLLAMAAMVFSLFAAAGHLHAGETKTFQITAKNYEFQPAVINVDQGDRVVLEITSTEGHHGFGIDALNINEDLPQGKTVVVEFVADKKGEFTIKCTVFCGWGHSNMKARLVVS